MPAFFLTGTIDWETDSVGIQPDDHGLLEEQEVLIGQVARTPYVGCVPLRSGGNHNIYVNPKTGKKQPVPRHSEIDEHLAAHILRYLGLEQ